jgi:hypothetical protein
VEATVNYLESIEFKLKCANYHKEKCFEALDKPILFDTDESRLIAVSAEFTSMMLVFQSTIDILAQFINQKRNLGLSRDQLYFSSIMYFDFFNTSSKLEGIKEQLSTLHSDSRYLFKYCNTIKHRDLIYISDEWFFVSNYQTVQYFFVDSFSRYSKKELNELLFDTFNKITTDIKNLKS